MNKVIKRDNQQMGNNEYSRLETKNDYQKGRQPDQKGRQPEKGTITSTIGLK